MLRHGGVLAIDNSLGRSQVADASNTDDRTAAIREAVVGVRDNADLRSTLLPVGDGLLVAVKL